MDAQDLISKLKKNPLVSGLTFTDFDSRLIIKKEIHDNDGIMDAHVFNTIKNYCDVSCVKVRRNEIVVFVTIRD